MKKFLSTAMAFILAVTLIFPIMAFAEAEKDSFTEHISQITADNVKIGRDYLGEYHLYSEPEFLIVTDGGEVIKAKNNVKFDFDGNTYYLSYEPSFIDTKDGADKVKVFKVSDKDLYIDSIDFTGDFKVDDCSAGQNFKVLMGKIADYSGEFFKNIFTVKLYFAYLNIAAIGRNISAFIKAI